MSLKKSYCIYMEVPIIGIFLIQWSFAKQLAQKTNATIIIPDYPLAPKATYKQVYSYMNELYKELILQYTL